MRSMLRYLHREPKDNKRNRKQRGHQGADIEPPICFLALQLVSQFSHRTHSLRFPIGDASVIVHVRAVDHKYGMSARVIRAILLFPFLGKATQLHWLASDGN